MKLGLFTDPHYSSKIMTCRTRRPRRSYGKIKEAMEYFKEMGVDTVICLGDLVDDCGKRDKNIEKIKEISSLIHSFGIPFLCMMGNHDYYNFTKEEFGELTGGALPPFELVFGNTALVFLDANYYEDGESYSPKNVDWTKTNLPADQLSRLRKILADEKIEKLYLFTHQNLDPEVEPHHIIKNADEIRALLKDSEKCVNVLQGHYHKGHDTVIDGIPYHTLPAMCEGKKNYFEIVEM